MPDEFATSCSDLYEVPLTIPVQESTTGLREILLLNPERKILTPKSYISPAVDSGGTIILVILFKPSAVYVLQGYSVPDG